MYGSSLNQQEIPSMHSILSGLTYKTKNVSAWTETFFELKNREYFIPTS